MEKVQLFNAGEKMERLLKKYIELEQDKSEQAYALSLMGKLYFESIHIRSEEQGMECCARAIELDPTSRFPYYTRANFLCYDLPLEEKSDDTESDLIRIARFETAVRDILISMELNRGTNQDNYDEIFLLNNLLEEWEASEVITVFTKLLADFPSSAPLYYHLGVAHLLESDFQSQECHTIIALDYLNKSIEYNPNSWAAHNMKGIVHGKISNYDDAIQAFTRAIEIEDLEWSVYSNRAYAYLLIGDIKRAIKDLKKALPLLEDEDSNDDLLELITALKKHKYKVFVRDESGRKFIHLSIPSPLDLDEEVYKFPVIFATVEGLDYL
ncbi:MAG: tetratricopeptide repeat protein [Clostridiaceae bacterium]|jgi:tetratricopeptide (TPR) repeat protein|nr:tetratricopeptide repeat protein [Clostridiaceae bacterium]